MGRNSPSRRRFLAGAGAALGLAGCSSDEELSPGRTRTTSGTGTAAEPPASATATTTDQTAPDVDLGAVYMPFFADPERWDTCTGGTPAPGPYDMTDRDAVAKHLAWMRQYGISRLMLSFGARTQVEPFFETLGAIRADQRTTAATTPVDRVSIEPMYGIPNAMRWGQDDHVAQLKSDVAYLRSILAREDVATVEGRPVLSIWDIGFVTVTATDVSTAVRGAILDEWGDFPSFVAFARDQLTVDGVKPYLVGGVRDHMQSGPWPELASLAAALDGIQTWVDSFSGGAVTEWETVRADVRETFKATRGFAREEELDFIPTVFPGFDDRPNDCWGGDRAIPRRREGLRSLFDLAEEYRTGDRITLATFNDWGEGSQVEPGTWQGEAYGTSYLETVRERVGGAGE